MEHPIFRKLDHVALVVPDTEAALAVWRDRVGLRVLYSEVVNEGAIRLTHLDLGNTHLQLVEPLTESHPLKAWLTQHGPGLHHLCMAVDDVGEAHEALANLGLGVAPSPHQGTQGKRALFLKPDSTMGVVLEVTGP
jgi:methylmalonyl-CoA/ethylmalonyl-CoA epimerase